MKKLVLFAMILGISVNSNAQDQAAQTLLAYFSGSCKTSAHWTQAAIADSNALIKTLTAMANDPDCAGASGAISQLNNLASQLTTLEKLNETKNAISVYNAEEQELLIQLTKTTDPDALYDINENLRELQIKRARLLSKDKIGESLSGEDKVTILAQVAQSANSSFAQITANQKCVDKNPTLLKSATAIMAGVGSAATLVNPAIGLTMTAGSTFAKVAMDGIRNHRYARTIRNISDSTVTFEAYSCALESMADRWCQMQDAESFLNFKARNRRTEIGNQDFAKAISLNDREIPVILDWLNKVRNGVSPRTTADAQRRRVVLSRELMVRSQADFGLSLIEQNRNTYDSLEGKPDDQQWLFLRSIITSLAPQHVDSSEVKNPLNDIYAAMYSPYYLIGLREDDPRIRSVNGIYVFSSWNKPKDVIVTLDAVKARYVEWINRASNLVNRELTEVQQPDPLQTLSSANIESEPWMVTPLDALKTITDFLEKNPPGERQQDFERIYRDTLEKLKKIHDTIAVTIITGDVSPGFDESGLTPIEQIYETAQLKYGIVVLQARLEMIVRLSLLEYIKNSPEEDQVLIAQLLAADRFFESIGRMSGTSSFAVLKEDIKRGKAYTMLNLSSFMNIFGFNINRSLQKLYNSERRSTPSVAQSYRDLRTSMCFLILGAENVEQWVDLRLCSGLKMEAMEPGGPESVTLSADTFKQDLAKRACTYREYFRQSDIYQKWGIKNK